MTRHVAAIVFVLCGVLIFGAETSFRCYQCNSISDASKCLDPFDSNGTAKCTETRKCYKQIYRGNDVTVIIRGCMDDAKDDLIPLVNFTTTKPLPTTPISFVKETSYCSESYLENIRATFCYCNTDLCNFASQRLASGSLIAMVTAMLTAVNL